MVQWYFHWRGALLLWACAAQLVPQGEAVIDGTRPATNKLTRSPHFGGCNIELTSMLKSGSTWTEIVVLMLSQRACDNDPTCTFSEVHARGRSAHNRTVGFHFDTATERPGVEFGQCNRSVQFNSAHKHNFWGLSFYREGLSDRRSVFALLHNKCVWQNLDLKSEECFQAMLEAAPDKGRMQMMRDHWLTVACLRDPRAVAVSECHWMGHSTGAGQEGGLGSSKRPACRETTTKFQTLVFATAFLYNYWTNILPNRSHLVVYEKMVTDPRTEYRRIADFIGVGSLVSDEEIAVIADETTATALAKKEVDGTLLGKTKVSNFNPSKQVSVRAHEANGSHVGFEGLDGAKVYRGTAKGFLEDVTDDELQAMNKVMRKYLQPELLKLFGVDEVGRTARDRVV